MPQLGGAGNLWANVTIANDTGSSIQTIFQNDLTNLNYVNGYRGRLGLMPICDTGGVVTYLERIRIEVMLIGQDGRTEITGWFVEDAVVRRNQPGVRRLSGMNMRRQLYFATPRGNASLFRGREKKWYC